MQRSTPPASSIVPPHLQMASEPNPLVEYTSLLILYISNTRYTSHLQILTSLSPFLFSSLFEISDLSEPSRIESMSKRGCRNWVRKVAAPSNKSPRTTAKLPTRLLSKTLDQQNYAATNNQSIRLIRQLKPRNFIIKMFSILYLVDANTSNHLDSLEEKHQQKSETPCWTIVLNKILGEVSLQFGKKLPLSCWEPLTMQCF